MRLFYNRKKSAKTSVCFVLAAALFSCTFPDSCAPNTDAGISSDSLVVLNYGKYLDVRNMTTTDTIDLSGDAIKINSSAEKLYYEGKLESTLMPWDIQIRYFLDGREYSAEDKAFYLRAAAGKPQAVI